MVWLGKCGMVWYSMRCYGVVGGVVGNGVVWWGFICQPNVSQRMSNDDFDLLFIITVLID